MIHIAGQVLFWSAIAVGVVYVTTDDPTQAVALARTIAQVVGVVAGALFEASGALFDGFTSAGGGPAVTP